MQLFNKRKPKESDPLFEFSDQRFIEAVKSFPYEKANYGDTIKEIYQLKKLIDSGHRPLYDEIMKYKKLIDKGSSLWFQINGSIIEKHDSSKPVERIKKLPYKITWCKLPK